ncbi:MAG: TerC/Alx family metal homeostasis membrane protein [Bacteroidota bacterium]|nr:TerC/Alx family metal homeostasis membrane protein [Bacteroidota bacterium]
MNSAELSYLVFGIILLLAVILDLGLLSKRSKSISIKKALYQTFFWIALALAYGIFVWYSQNKITAIEYISAYLMEWSLSIDNIFVFILIFTFFGIKKQYYGRVLLLGILGAIVFRIIFITIGIALVANFGWILYLFGAFLVFTGIKMFFVEQDDEFDPGKNKVYIFLQKFLLITNEDAAGKFTKHIKGKKYFTMLFVVVILLATTDIVFALDSIPAVFAITQNKMVIYTSNIFAVLGLRSLFFLLRGAVSKFDYLQQGIAIVLVFIGIKMLIEYFHIHIPIGVSLSVIIVCLAGSILFSVYHKKIDIPEDDNESF